MTPGLVVLRADASPVIGRGHVARCRAVAAALRARGVAVLLLSHRLPEALARGYTRLGCKLHDLDDPRDPGEVVRVLEEAGAVDAETTLLVDHYELGSTWESAMRAVVGRVAALDDRPVRRHDVDLVIDAGGGSDRARGYAEHLPEDAQIVTGQDHAIIDPVYARLRERLPVRDGAVQRVLLQLGSDRSALVEEIARVVVSLGRASLQVDVVVPSDHPYRRAVTELIEPHGWRVHVDVDDIWRLYAVADLAIGAPGVSVWERCALGVPTLVIETTAMHAGAYADLGPSLAVTRLGPADHLDVAGIAGSIDTELARTDLGERSKACRALVDGRGAGRVASLLTVTPQSPLRIRDVRPDDEARLLRWANDRDSRAWSFSSDGITEPEHHRWLTSRLRSIEDHHLYLLEDRWGSEVGHTRFARTPEGWRLSAVLAPGYRARGLAEAIVALSREQLIADVETPCTIVATVRMVRPGAGQVLSRLGFEIAERDVDDAWVTYRWTAS